MQVKIKRYNPREYYIVIKTKMAMNDLILDYEISKKLNLTKEKYRQKIRNIVKDNSYIGRLSGDIIFSNKSDAKKVKEWIESILLIKKMEEDKNEISR
jgi:hypothetical protein